MDKPVIIFGAGASYSLKNISRTNLKRSGLYPPLTKELFDERFSDIIGRFGLIKEILEQIRAMTQNGGNFEEYLSSLYKENRFETQAQLTEIQLYLRDLFDSIQSEYLKADFKETSYYYHFLRKLKYCHSKACVITFNYDLFLDEAMEGVFEHKYTNIDSYYKNVDYELYKVHGSINWLYLFDLLEGEGHDSLLNKVRYIIEYKESHEKKGIPLRTLGVIREMVRKKKSFNYEQVPALAIPLPEGKNFIVDEHEQNIIDNLRQTNKLIIIGWSAGDDYFVNKIIENIDYEKVKLVVVDPEPHNIIKNLTPKKEHELLATPIKKWKYEPKIITDTFTNLVNDPNNINEVFSY